MSSDGFAACQACGTVFEAVTQHDAEVEAMMCCPGGDQGDADE